MKTSRASTRPRCRVRKRQMEKTFRLAFAVKAHPRRQPGAATPSSQHPFERLFAHKAEIKVKRQEPSLASRMHHRAMAGLSAAGTTLAQVMNQAQRHANQIEREARQRMLAEQRRRRLGHARRVALHGGDDNGLGPWRRSAPMTLWELYQWYKQNGMLEAFFAMYPSF